MATFGKPVCVVPSGDWCGEGLVWHPAHQSLYWTDINRFLIHCFHPASGDTRSWLFDEPVTSMMLTDRDDTLLVALGSRLIFWEPANDHRRDQGYRLPHWPAVRLNDARPGPDGAAWLGTMRNNVNPDGSAGKAGGTDGILVSVAPEGTVREWRRDIGISNTMSWSPDRTRFYSADTLANVMRVYDYDAATGTISNERPFFADFSRGVPDGSEIDSEGYLWNCRHGGGCIVRIAPDGALDRVLDMPAQNVTNCTFGGPDLRTLYVTSAALGAPKGERFAGSVFALESGVPGLPSCRFKTTARP